MDFQQVVQQRRMVRAFREQPLAPQVVERILANGTIRLGAPWVSVSRRLRGTEVMVRVSAGLLQVAQDGLLVKTMPVPAGLNPMRLPDMPARPTQGRWGGWGQCW